MTIDVGVEVDALFLDFSESGEGKYLKAAGIGEDRTVPVHKPVEAAELLDQLVAGPDMKMVGVGKLHLCPDPAKVIGGHSALDRGDSSYIHESFFACFSAASFFCFFVVITYHIAPVRHTEE